MSFIIKLLAIIILTPIAIYFLGLMAVVGIALMESL